MIEEALARLEKVDGRQCQVVEMRFFAGMSEDEIAKCWEFRSAPLIANGDGALLAIQGSCTDYSLAVGAR